MSTNQEEKIAVIGLGYVGLPVAIAFARKYPTVGFDVSAARIEELLRGHDSTCEVSDEELKDSSVLLTSDFKRLNDATFFIVAVPTPIDQDRRPDLRPLLSVCETIGSHVRKGDVVVFESTVYPGVTEEICGPVLEQASGLKSGVDFFLAYSPERIVPGDKERTFEKILKIVSGQNEAVLERVAVAYESVVKPGVHRAPSIKVAEAAKVIENTQRDLNIALMNELALIFDRIGIRTADVLEAAGTKWNFLPFRPGLVGGHCIGVDPYYLTSKAEAMGYQPRVILAGRSINNGVGSYLGQRTIKMLAHAGKSIKGARVGIWGLTFKENVPDLRSSRVPDIIAELSEYGVEMIVHDPIANPAEALEEYDVRLQPWEELTQLDAVVYAVAHRFYAELSRDEFFGCLNGDGVLIDVKSQVAPKSVPEGIGYWSL